MSQKQQLDVKFRAVLIQKHETIKKNTQLEMKHTMQVSLKVVTLSSCIKSTLFSLSPSKSTPFWLYMPLQSVDLATLSQFNASNWPFPPLPLL